MSPRNVPQEEAFFPGCDLQITTQSRYLVGFVGTEADQAWWLAEKVGGWKALVAVMSGVACKHPKTAYAGLHKSLHQEWYFLQRATSTIGTEFQTIEDALRKHFLLYLFKGAIYQIPRRSVTGMPVNQAGISLPYPTETAISKWTASCVITGHFVPVPHGTAEFRSLDHTLLMGEGRNKICWRHVEVK